MASFFVCWLCWFCFFLCFFVSFFVVFCWLLCWTSSPNSPGRNLSLFCHLFGAEFGIPRRKNGTGHIWHTWCPDSYVWTSVEKEGCFWGESFASKPRITGFFFEWKRSNTWNMEAQMRHEKTPGVPYFPVYWLFNRDPYFMVYYNPLYTWVVFHPL